MLNSPSNLMFKFGAKFAEVDKKFTITRNAIDELTDQVNTIIKSDIDTLNSKITKNTEDITDLDSTKADTSYVNNCIAEITSRVTTNESDTSSLDIDLNALTSRVTTNESDISSLDIDLNALTTKVTTNETDIKKYGGWINNLVSSVAYNKMNPFNDFYKHLFDMIYPIGSIYTTVNTADPPNVYDLSGNAYATWDMLTEGQFLRNTQKANNLCNTGGTAVTQLPAHTHTTNVTIDGKLYSASRGETLVGESYDSKLINCGLFAPKIDGEDNVFFNTKTVKDNPIPINWSTDAGTDAKKDESRSTSSSAETTTYFPITLSVNKNYATNSESTTALNNKVDVIANDKLPDNCPPFMYVKMYRRTA